MYTINSMKKLSLLIPAYNEQEVLEPLFVRLEKLAKTLNKYDFEFMLVDDGSHDKTLEIIRDKARQDNRYKFVSLSRNFGKEIAMIAGLDKVSGDGVVILDADLQNPPELIAEMVEHWEAGYDDVYAKHLARAGETWFKKATSKLFYRLLQKTTNIPIQVDVGDFRLLDRRCIEALKQIRENQRYTKGMFSWIGFKKKEIYYKAEPRLAGKTKWNYGKLFNFAIDGVTSFTTAPLRLSSILGFIVSFVAFLYILVVIIKTWLFGEAVAGYPSMMAVILFLGGVQLLSLGVIGEYIGRIFTEVKNRPLYLVKDSNVKNKDSKEN